MVLLLLALHASAVTSTLTLTWNPVAGSNIAGYRLYQGGASRTYTNSLDAGGATNKMLSGLSLGAVYFFAVTAYNTNGLESPYSAELSFTVPLTVPPVVVLDSPLAGAAYTAPATINLAATVTANGHSITKVQFYNGASLLGESASAPFSFAWNNVSAGSFNLAARLIYDAGSSIDSIAAPVTVAASRPAPSLTFAADSGVITSPFVTNNGTVYQNVETGVTTGGRAAYSFTIPSPAPYFVSASVNAPDGGANSFYVNIDAEPTDPLMIWDLSVTSGFTNQFVTWRGEGSSVPKMFNLSAGAHQLIVRGREANAQLGTISIVPVSSLFPILQLQVSPSRQVLLSGAGPAGHAYDVLAAQSLNSWTTLGFVTVDARGSLQFTDPTPAVSSARSYRLRESVPVPTLQISVLPTGQALLTGSGTPGHKYEVWQAQNLIDWTVIGTATVNAAGVFQFIDATASGASVSYRLQETLP